MPKQQPSLVLALAATLLLGFLQTVCASNFQITVCKKDGSVATDVSNLTITDRAGNTITADGHTFSNGTHTFSVNPANVQGDKSIIFTITRGTASTTTRGSWSASPKNPSILSIVVD